MAGILIYGYAIEERVGILDNLENKEHLILDSLIKSLEFNRRQIVLAASEVIGKKLASGNSGELETELLVILSKKEAKDLGVMVAVLEKVCNFYPQILNQKSLINRLSGFFGSLSGVSRAALLRCVLKYADFVKTANDYLNIADLAEYLFRDRNKIVNDSEDSHRLALLDLLIKLFELLLNQNVKKAVSGYITLLGPYAMSQNFDIRKALYTLMHKAYDESNALEDAGRIRTKSKEILIKALGETNQELSDYIVDF